MDLPADNEHRTEGPCHFLSLLQEVFKHITELRKHPYCMTISVCPWYVLIMMLKNVVDKCAIVDWSGDNVDQRRKRVWFWFRKSWQTRATWHRGLPCWKTWSEKSLKIPKGQSESWLTVMEYLCHKWPRICPTCRKHFPVLYPFTICYRVCY
jgi:hypothetical protein